MIEYCMVAL